jgi:hypothetical protein
MSPSTSLPIELHVAQSGDPFLVHPDGWVRIVQDRVKNGVESIAITFMDGGSTRVSEDYATVKRLLIGGE